MHPSTGPAAPRIGRPAREPASARERLEAALALWNAGRPLGHTLAARYCRLRGLEQALPGPHALRHHGEVPVSVYRPGRLRRPALIAGIQEPGGRYVAVEVTYLAPNGRRAVDLHLPRKTIGVTPPGCAVRLDPPAEEMLVGEGVFATRAASEWFALPGWALQSTRNLRAWSPPEGVRSVLIAGDRGKDGEASAEVLRGRLAEAGGDGARGVAARALAAVGPMAQPGDAGAGRGGKGRGRDRAGAPRGRMTLAQALEPDPDDRHPHRPFG